LVDRFLRETPEVLEKLTIIQEVVEAGERRAEHRGEQQTLLLALRHKFGELPAQLVEKGSATTEAAQLERWIEQALDANTLTEIDLNPLAAADNPASHP
jgi:hypothetical protein